MFFIFRTISPVGKRELFLIKELRFFYRGSLYKIESLTSSPDKSLEFKGNVDRSLNRDFFLRGVEEEFSLDLFKINGYEYPHITSLEQAKEFIASIKKARKESKSKLINIKF